MDIRQINEHYAEVAADLIDTEPVLEKIRNSEVTILYLSSEHEMKKNKKKVLGQCEKIADKYKWAIPCDFTITIFEPNVEDLTEEQLKTLLLHELLHIGIEENKDGEEVYSTIPHDIEDFRLIIDRYGLDWAGDGFELIGG